MNVMQNKVQLIGNLGVAPEIKSFGNGKKLARFTLATTRSFKNDKGEKINNTQWHKLVAWNRTAEHIEKLLTKGMRVAVDGELMNRSYTDRAGIKRSVKEILVNNLLIIRKTEGIRK